MNQRVTDLNRKCDQSNRSAEVSQQKAQSVQEESRNTIGRLESETERLKQQLELTNRQGYLQAQRIQEIHAQEMGRHEQEVLYIHFIPRGHICTPGDTLYTGDIFVSQGTLYTQGTYLDPRGPRVYCCLFR